MQLEENFSFISVVIKENSSDKNELRKHESFRFSGSFMEKEYNVSLTHSFLNVRLKV